MAAPGASIGVMIVHLQVMIVRLAAMIVYLPVMIVRLASPHVGPIDRRALVVDRRAPWDSSRPAGGSGVTALRWGTDRA